MDEYPSTTHHRPVAMAVPAQPLCGEHPMLTLTRDIARRLAAHLGLPVPREVTLYQFRHDAPAELRGWRRHEVRIAGRTVAFIGIQDPRLRDMPDYRIEVDREPVSCQFTPSRPLAQVLADAAHDAIRNTA